MDLDFFRSPSVVFEISKTPKPLDRYPVVVRHKLKEVHLLRFLAMDELHFGASGWLTKDTRSNILVLLLRKLTTTLTLQGCQANQVHRRNFTSYTAVCTKEHKEHNL
jgi:hypothetical protein